MYYVGRVETQALPLSKSSSHVLYLLNVVQFVLEHEHA